ncbi:hypothetical protein QQ020_23390 [Fulvivirgaceae bacterium BMA12]|uniref:Uncharacterized protein n=1 Tax=Agaribacillus aureus TaxID=3051825 RepID=A0ABT8LE45_9BACT|nr:hypothetical protein [Fulvivirgaceae bacterium BMA12]
MEDLKVSEDYKKAFNYADMICSYAPESLKEIKIPEKQSSEFLKGFQDRITQYEKEKKKEAIKYFSPEKLREKYGLSDPEKDRTKSIEKEK